MMCIGLFMNDETNAQTLAQCNPGFKKTETTCRKFRPGCQRLYNITIKFNTRGCRQPNGRKWSDGGCQCEGYCGYHCKSACNADSDW
jgi:hypothetical protein